MLTQCFTIGLLMLLAVMSPGPDFALVTKNTVLHSRESGFFTALGVALSNLIHISYCSLGLAFVIANSILLFSLIKYLGAGYLLYLGIMSLLSKPETHLVDEKRTQIKKKSLPKAIAFRQGFLCNLLNPKATLFFLALFTTIIKPETPALWVLIFIVEMFVIITLWFFTLTMILSHPKVTRLLEKSEKYIAKILGVFLVSFGIALAFVKR
ncbi:LysE family translocator [Legionella tunisiensis]|uniref:LysE family translocator n=1 Tax=Legionella tunisiensis TaxID=1034944 RepID=UPI0002DE0073|nr:LysE family transporter [Legionella tunisiensis]